MRDHLVRTVNMYMWYLIFIFIHKTSERHTFETVISFKYYLAHEQKRSKPTLNALGSCCLEQGVVLTGWEPFFHIGREVCRKFTLLDGGPGCDVGCTGGIPHQPRVPPEPWVQGPQSSIPLFVVSIEHSQLHQIQHLITRCHGNWILCLCCGVQETSEVADNIYLPLYQWLLGRIDH